MRARGSCGFGLGGGCGTRAVGRMVTVTATATAAGAGAAGPFVPLAPSASALTHSCRSFYKTHPPLCRVRTLRFHTLRATRSASLQPPAVAISDQDQRRLSSSSNMSELKWPSALVRKAFFDYMQQRGHTIGMQNCPSFTWPRRPSSTRFCHTVKCQPRRTRNRVETFFDYF